MARLHSPSSGTGARKICLACEWGTLVVVSPIQVVGSAFYAPQTLDVALRCPTYKEHHAFNRDSFCFKRIRYLVQHLTHAYFVSTGNCVAIIYRILSNKDEFIEGIQTSRCSECTSAGGLIMGCLAT